jgi:hypothetical protein
MIIAVTMSKRRDGMPWEGKREKGWLRWGRKRRGKLTFEK